MERKETPQERYEKANIIQVKFKVNKRTDGDIIEWLEKQGNKQGAIKALIRKAIEEGK